MVWVFGMRNYNFFGGGGGKSIGLKEGKVHIYFFSLLASDEVVIRHQGPARLVLLVLISNLEFLVAEAVGNSKLLSH